MLLKVKFYLGGNDVGWGKEVAEGKINGFFSNNLVEGSIELILERWKPELFP